MTTTSHQDTDRQKLMVEAIDQATNLRLRDIQKRNLGTRATEIALAEADAAKRALRSLSISFETAIPATIDTIRRPEHVHRVVCVRGSLAHMGEVRQVEMPRTQSTTLMDLLGERSDEVTSPVVTGLMSHLIIRGDGDTVVTTKPFIDRKMVNQLQDLGTRFATWEFLLFVVPSTAESLTEAESQDSQTVGTVRTYEFYLVDARPLVSAIQVVAPTPGEAEQAEATLAKDPQVLETITGQLIRRLEILSSDHLPILTETIRFQVLAAATEGARAHTLVIGPPGLGKSLIHKAAGLVQPIMKHAMPTKATEAGLVGDGHSNRKNRRPGLIPLAHTGAFSVEDFNQANSVKNQRFCAVFTNTMAEGRISDASAAKVEYAASVSIILDANRKSDVRRTSSVKEGFDRLVEDIGLPMNVLSRTTYIAEIPRDAPLQLGIACEILRKKGSLSETDRRVLDEQLRLARVYLAMMRDRHRTVHLSEQVRQHLEDQVLAISNTTAERFDRHVEFADFLTRLGQQALMLVEAHARLHNRGEATRADVDAIFPFLWRKLDWLKTTLFGGQAETPVITANEKARRSLIRMRLGTWRGATCTAQEVRRKLGLNSASVATIQNDLWALLGEPDAKGVYKVVSVEPGHVA